jgi:hypothetical protein
VTPLRGGTWEVEFDADGPYPGLSAATTLCDGINEPGLDRLELEIHATVAGYDQIDIPDDVAREGADAVMDYLAERLDIDRDALDEYEIDIEVAGYSGYREDG